MLGSRRPSAQTTLLVDFNIEKANISVPSTPPPATAIYIKKLTQRRNRALPHLQHAFLSTKLPVGLPLHRRHARTTAACSPTAAEPLPPRHARPAHPIVVVASTAATTRWGHYTRPITWASVAAHQGAAQLPARCHPQTFK